MVRKKKTLKDLVDKVHVGDARKLSKILPTNSVDVTVTSPPYFNMKDYGSPNQIGFGQVYDDYLADLALVFKEIYRATKGRGSLWIIVDTFRKDNEVIPLPFDIATRLRQVGWTLRDIVIWKKERTVPWAQENGTRKIFEYILVFAKGTGVFNYDQDKFREIDGLKKWWVRYPERYSPKGKAPEEIWCYDIPTQGSWGDHYVRHFCPLPTDLVSRIIQQTTSKNEVVLDPFAGSGTVPTASRLLKRKYLGFELNSKYVEMFRKHLEQQLKLEKSRNNEPPIAARKAFEATIASLRILKYGRLVLRQLAKEIPAPLPKIFAFSSKTKPTEKFKYYSADYVIVAKGISKKTIQDIVDSYTRKPPLSKFGIQPSWKIVSSLSGFSSTQRKKKYFMYSLTNSHYHCGNTKLSEALNGSGNLFSPIKAEVEEPDG